MGMLLVIFLLSLLHHALLGINELLSIGQKCTKVCGELLGEGKIKNICMQPLFMADMVTEGSWPWTSSMVALKQPM